jgi:hypothetical protein
LPPSFQVIAQKQSSPAAHLLPGAQQLVGGCGCTSGYTFEHMMRDAGIKQRPVENMMGGASAYLLGQIKNELPNQDWIKNMH